MLRTGDSLAQEQGRLVPGCESLLLSMSIRTEARLRPRIAGLTRKFLHHLPRFSILWQRDVWIDLTWDLAMICSSQHVLY